MKEIFHKTPFSTQKVEVNEKHTTKYGNKSLICPHTWNSQIKLKKKMTTVSSKNLLTIDLLSSINVFMFFFDLIYKCQFNITSTTSNLTRF